MCLEGSNWQIVAMNKLNNIWVRNNKRKQTLKVKLYKSLVKPIILYNSGTWGLTKKKV